MYIVNNRIFFFVLSFLLIVGSCVAVWNYGINFGIDFKGGSVLEISYVSVDGSRVPTLDEVKTIVDADVQNSLVSPRGTTGYIIKTKEITQEEKNILISHLTTNGANPVTVEKFNAIGPIVGNELKQKAYTAIAVVVLCIMMFIMFAFRRLKHPLNYGIATIIALIHDVIIPTGVYVVYSHITGAEVDLLFVTALLAILGYSVHDTIVVFDRVRENMMRDGSGKNSHTFEQNVGASITQTLGRSINTSVTIFISLLALYFVGGHSTQNFAFILLVGVIIGTYSSIFVASPLLVTFEGWRKK